MNYLKYRCIFRGPGKLAVGGNAYSYGDEFVLPADQAQKLASQKYLENGTLEFLGEVDENTLSLSSNFVGYMEGIQGTAKRNYLPMSSFDIDISDNVWDNGENTLAFGNYYPRKKMALGKILTKVGAFPSPHNSGFLYIHNRCSLIVTKSSEGFGCDATQITSDAYMDNNGTLGSLGLPESGTVIDSLVYAQDTLYVGYSSKFANVYVYMTSTNVDEAEISSIKYWNGSSWTAFNSVYDGTSRSGVSLGGNGFIAWFEKPENWNKYDAVASAHSLVNSETALTNNVYWVAITFTSGVDSYDLDADVEISSIYVPNEDVIAEVSLSSFYGGGNEQPDKFTSVVKSDAGVLSEVSTTAAPILLNWTMDDTDAIYVGFDEKFGGIGAIIGATKNAASRTLTASYWDGASWVSLSATDGTSSGGKTLAQDGTITWNNQLMWQKAAASSTLLGDTPPTTTSTDELFWVKITVSGALTSNFDLHQLYILRSTIVPIEVIIGANTALQPEDYINVYIGEDQVYGTALSGVSLKFIGADI
jgi:hypothetical protein